MNWIKKLLKGLLFFLLIVLVILTVLFVIYNKPLPEGEMGIKANALAEKMQTAINQSAWDSTRFVEWTFMDIHHFVWDKERNFVQVKWEDNRVLLNPTKQEGVAYKSGQKVDDLGLIKSANSFFINDAFWLNAPAQMTGNRDIKLEAVTLKDQTEGLLITYLSGGDTPGDSYLWILDDNGLPEAWQMWVKIIPIGGLEFSWNNWTELPTGAKVATQHQGIGTISITNLKSYQESAKDIFAELESN